MGEWKGGEFCTGHKVNGQLEKAGWFGKTFTSPSDVQPLVCVDAEGNKFSTKELGKGEASTTTSNSNGSEVIASVTLQSHPAKD